MSVSVVLDSWAVLRFLEDAPPAADAVAQLLEEQRPVMSWINLGEVHYVVLRAHGEDAAAEATRDLRALVTCVLPDERTVLEAARIKAGHPLAYADAFAAATAVLHDAALWTGDPELLVPGSSWRWRDLRAQPGAR
ncbi:PIN domain-containing protein [Quadrisphaera sp. GCM10027208]|uniref:PIN domain-containing protein n=1 Tax=Quadrisphaera sp. GCM10027208 TaxID=3273423 RepID=UPI00361D41EE